MEEELFIIDDDPIYRLIVSKMTARIDPDLKISQCENGEIGLSNLETRRGASHRIIVILDLNMPVLDGWGFLDKIEDHSFFDLKNMSINLVTSSTDETDIERARNYSFIKGLYHKPLRIDDIKALLCID